MTLFTRADAWLFASGEARQVSWLRTLLALIAVVRIVSWPFSALSAMPDGLFRPPVILSFLGAVPSQHAIVVVQVVGALAGLVAALGRRFARAGFALCWLALCLLVGLKTSAGKTLHNDLLLLLTCAPLLIAPATRGHQDRRQSPAYGWPTRAALLTLALVYLACGVQKLRHSGIAWVTSDNMGWVLAAGAQSGRAPTTVVATFIAERAWLAHVAAAALVGLELAFPVALFWRRSRQLFAVAAVALHSMTWVTLGLDYWAWSLVAVAVLGVDACRDRGPHRSTWRTRAMAPPPLLQSLRPALSLGLRRPYLAGGPASSRSSRRDDISRLARMWVSWVWIVRANPNRRWAISELVRPCLTSSTTPVSAGARLPHPGDARILDPRPRDAHATASSAEIAALTVLGPDPWR